MQILLIHKDIRKSRQLKKWIMECYPNSHVTVCSSAAHAMEYIDVVGGYVHLCFTDIQMRDGSGIQITKALRENNWNTRIVFMADTGAYAMEAWQLGVNDYLIEPITRESIQHTLENCS